MGSSGSSLVDLAAGLLARGGGLQSADGGGAIDDERLVDAVRAAIEAAAEPVPGAEDESLRRAAARRVVAGARAAIREVAEGRSASNLTDEQRANLEAIVHVIGRPAVPYARCHVGLPPVELGENERWIVLINAFRGDINRVSQSVARMELADVSGPGGFLGTGWRTAVNLLVTNRHVIHPLVANASDSPASWAFKPDARIALDFCATADSHSQRLLTSAAVVHCAPEPDIDLAVLRIGDAAAAVPALSIDWSSDSAPQVGGEVYIVGHPYRDVESVASQLVFGRSDGAKRWAPGEITSVAGCAPVFEHDCSTLGGNSGSCVFDMQMHTVVGLHVGGRNVNDATSRGEANIAVRLAALGSHPAVPVLKGSAHGT